jgi:HPt (histidine-containing phosphotransfer) domain-containing protein
MLALAVDESAAGPVLDLGNRTVLIATEDEGFAGELAVLLDQWNADARWAGDADSALAELARHDTPEPPVLTPVLVIDGRGKLLSALSLAHHAAQIGDDAPFILLAADAVQIESLGEVDQGEIDGFLPLPVSEALLANVFHSMPLGPPGPDPLAVRRLVDPPRATAKRQAETDEPNERASDRITPIAAHPKFVPDMATMLDMRAIEGLRALDGSPGFLEEVIATFRADARQIMERIDHEAAAADAAGFAHGLSALRRAASPLGATQLCELLASLHGLTASELRQQGALHVQRLDAEIERLAATLTEFLPAGEARLR